MDHCYDPSKALLSFSKSLFICTYCYFFSPFLSNFLKIYCGDIIIFFPIYDLRDVVYLTRAIINMMEDIDEIFM